MKTLKIFAVLITTLIVVACTSQPQKQAEPAVMAESQDSDRIQAYYFHFTARCTTCKTIEAETIKDLESLYPEHVKTGLITFRSLNLDEESGRSIAQNLGVTAQTLMLVKGGQKINLTNDGFLYAVPKPEKFRQIINDNIDLLLSAR